MKKYILMLKQGVEEFIAHRAQMLLWVVVSIVPPGFSLFVFRNLEGVNSDYVTAYFLASVIVRLCTLVFVEEFVADFIFSGQLVFYLMKPFSFVRAMYVRYAPSPIVKSFLALPALVLIVWFLAGLGVFDGMNVLYVVAFLVSVVLGLCVALGMSIVLGSTAFWLHRVGFINNIHLFLVLTFGGGLFPLEFFPQWAQPVLKFLPFRYMIDFQVKALIDPSSLKLVEFGMLLFYAVLMYLLAIVVFKRGVRRYEAYGN